MSYEPRFIRPSDQRPPQAYAEWLQREAAVHEHRRFKRGLRNGLLLVTPFWLAIAAAWYGSDVAIDAWQAAEHELVGNR